MIKMYIGTYEHGEGRREIHKYNVGARSKAFIFRNDNDKFEFTFDRNEADALLVQGLPEKCTVAEYQSYIKTFPKLRDIVNVGSLFHVDEHFDYKWEEERFLKYLVDLDIKYHHVHPEPLQKDVGVFYDYSFNIVKYGFSSTGEILTRDQFDHMWNVDPRMYHIGVVRMWHDKSSWRTFLSPNRVFPNMEHSRNTARRAITHFMSCNSAYYTDNLNDKYLPAQFTDQGTGENLYSGMAGFWFPVHDWYYRNTFVSCPVESGIKLDKCLIVTEKTWIPIMKGHFVMPFGAPGIVRHLKTTYGIKFPDWIDYRYDDVEDSLDRLSSYLDCLNKLSKIPIHDLYDLWQKDKDMLEQNKNAIINTLPQSGFDSIEWNTEK